jgi:hypothetical protein
MESTSKLQTSLSSKEAAVSHVVTFMSLLLYPLVSILQEDMWSGHYTEDNNPNSLASQPTADSQLL